MKASIDAGRTPKSLNPTIDWSALHLSRRQFDAQSTIAVVNLCLKYSDRLEEQGRDELADIYKGMARDMILAVLATDGDVPSLRTAVDKVYGGQH